MFIIVLIRSLPHPLPAQSFPPLLLYQKLDSENYDQNGKSKDNRKLTRSWLGWISNKA